jgi:hypothetical protein
MAVAAPPPPPRTTFFGPKSNVIPVLSGSGDEDAVFEPPNRSRTGHIPPEDRLIEQLVQHTFRQPRDGPGKDAPISDWANSRLNLEQQQQQHKRLLERTRVELNDRDKRQKMAQQVASNVQRNMLERRYPTTLYKLLKLRKCMRCATEFRRIKSIGRWECTQHVGTVNGLTRQWSCCGQDPAMKLRRACTPCDHTDRYPRRTGLPAWGVTDPELIALIQPPLHTVRMGPPLHNENEEQCWKFGPLDRLVSKQDKTQEEQAPHERLIREGMADHEVFQVERPRKMPQGVYFPSKYWLPEVKDGGAEATRPREQKTVKTQWIIATVQTVAES